MKKRICVPLSKCEHLIDNADILLFHCPEFPDIGWWISLFTTSKHSHTALAEKTEYGINCLEFKEFVGSRVYPLKKYIQDGKIVDVYRTPTIMKVPYASVPPVLNGHKPTIENSNLFFSQELRKKIVDEAHEMIGMNYGWFNIWKIFLTIAPFIRFFIRKNGVDVRPKHFVCSTFVSFLYRKYWLDLCPNVDDSCVTPGDICGNGLTQYLFTITEL
jgi:hypothetical protein